MKYLKITILAISFLLSKKVTFSQNARINILTQKAGIVKKGKKLFLEISITNTDHTDFIGIYKLKVQINLPSEIASIDTAGIILPTGWKILDANEASMIISNGMDMIAATDDRNIMLSIRGKKMGGPLTITGYLSFADGTEPGNKPGALKNDLAGDNNSTTTCTVTK